MSPMSSVSAVANSATLWLFRKWSAGEGVTVPAGGVVSVP
jgi:hypothetical protein